MKVLRSRAVVAVIASLITLGAVGTVAWASASTSNPSTTITGCVARHGDEDERGALRIIDPAHQQCRHDEALITWNQTGPQGPQGVQGVQGVPGAVGAPGKNGVNGDSANVAVTNEPPGVNCPTGGKKLTTSVGAGPATVSYVCNGTNGATGATGPQGAQGSSGISNYQVVSKSYTVDIPGIGSGAQGFDATCPTGTTVISGGVNTGNTGVGIIESAPLSNSWIGSVAGMIDADLGNVTFTIYAICVTVAS